MRNEEPSSDSNETHNDDAPDENLELPGDVRVFTRHRGPYRFVAIRSTPTRKMKWHSETLPGLVSGNAWEIVAEAKALVNDPRDTTILSILVYSDFEQMFVMTFPRTIKEGASDTVLDTSVGDNKASA